MRKHLIRTSATLALALTSAIAACGGLPAAANPSPTSSCVNASAPHHAYVVVEHLSGSSLQWCVGFSTDTIDGQTLMDQSDIQFQTQTFSFGKLACQIDHEPAQFSQCSPPNQPYWNLFIETSGAWKSASTGYTAITLNDKEALGWHYVQPTDPSPAPPPLAKG
ncbi:MAG TPA: hypothetical protein VIJ58_15080 [Candidatus Dormibacteraeota bacterium]